MWPCKGPFGLTLLLNEGVFLNLFYSFNSCSLPIGQQKLIRCVHCHYTLLEENQSWSNFPLAENRHDRPRARPISYLALHLIRLMDVKIVKEESNMPVGGTIIMAVSYQRR